jgi:hypothetical protein
MKCDANRGWCVCGQFHMKESPRNQELPAVSMSAAMDLTAAAKELGRRGGLKGGPARAKKLSPERRSTIARKAAEVRWDYPFGTPRIH